MLVRILGIIIISRLIFIPIVCQGIVSPDKSLSHHHSLRATSIFKPICQRNEEGELALVEYPQSPANVITALKVIRDNFEPTETFTLDNYLWALDEREESKHLPLRANGHVVSDETARRNLAKLVAEKILAIDKTKRPHVYFVRKRTKGIIAREEKLIAQKRSNDAKLKKRKENKENRLRSKGYYFFRKGMADGNSSLTSAIGAKGANLSEMANMGIPIPPGFAISTKITKEILNKGEFPIDFRKNLERYIKRIESQTDCRFGDNKNPLLLSVRGGAKYSMPGILGTVTNIGLNDQIVEGLAQWSGDRRFAYDCYIRFILEYAEVVLDIEDTVLEDIVKRELDRSGVNSIKVAPIGRLQSLIQILKSNIFKISHSQIPDDPWEQLTSSILAVVNSSNTQKAIKYKERNFISQDIVTAVNIQAMVFGNLGENSATGVAFTRNPLNGEREVFGEVLFNAQGRDIVSGRVTPLPMNELDGRMPDVAKELRKYLQLLEDRFKEIQDVEFIIQNGKLWILQTRGNERNVTPLARVRILMDLVQEEVILEDEALKRADLSNLLWFRKYIEVPTFIPKPQRKSLAIGIPASPGVAEGRACLDREEAITLSEQGKPIILVLNQAFVQDEEAIKATKGTLTRLGGATSHAAIIARGLEEMKPVITGVNEIEFEEDGFSIGDTKVREGDFIILDGNSGNVFKGRIEEDELIASEPTVSPYYKRLVNWIEMKQREEGTVALVREIELKTGKVDRIKQAVDNALQKAREALQAKPTEWREKMSKVTSELLWIAEKEDDKLQGRLTYEEAVFALKYIYREDEDMEILPRLMHAQALRHAEVENIFREYLDLEQDDFGIVLFNLMGRFNIGDFTAEEYDDFWTHSGFPIIRVLIRLRDYALQEKYLRGSSNETLASIIEEAVKFLSAFRENLLARAYYRLSYWDLEDAESIGKRIARMIYDDRELRDFLLGTEDSQGRLSQKAAEWFNGFMDEVRKERLEAERKQRLRETPVSIVEDMTMPRDEYPREIWDDVEDFTHEYYAYYGDAEGETGYKVSKIHDFSYNLYHDEPSVVEHMRQCLEYSFVDDDDYYLEPALNLVFFSYFMGSDNRAIQKVFSILSPKIVIKFLNYAAIVDTEEPILSSELLYDIETNKAEFFRDALVGQSKERMSRIKTSLIPEALSIATSLEKELPNLDSMAKAQESTGQCL